MDGANRNGKEGARLLPRHGDPSAGSDTHADREGGGSQVTEAASVRAPKERIARLPLRFPDLLFGWTATALAVLVLALLGGVVVSLMIGGLPAFRAFGLGFLVST